MSEEEKDQRPKKRQSPQDQRLLRAQQNGFGVGRHVDKTKRSVTENFQEKVDALPRLVDKTLEVYERGMDSNNIKIALEAADKFSKHFYRPKAQVEVSGSVDNNHTFNIKSVDELSEEDRKLLERAKLDPALSQELKDLEVLDAEIVEEE